MKHTITCSAFLVLALAGGGVAAQPAPGVQPMPLALMKRPATPAVLSLFTAASEGDEATFARLVGTVGNINDYVVNGNKLLHALLRPAASMEAEERDWRRTHEFDGRSQERWLAQRARHAALLPAKTRMLALALQHGAAVNDGDGASNAAALHLAATFGTAEMVRMLLAHGADPREVGGAFEDRTPFEYALAPDASRTTLTELITPQERSAILVLLLQANPERPYLRRDANDKTALHSADLLWNNLLQMTRGTAILDALERTGTRPYVNDTGKSPYAYAAEAGNVEALGWLKARVPRVGKDGSDRWLDAAIWALYLPPPDADAALAALLVHGMPWSQPGPLDGERLDRYTPMLGRHDLELASAPVLVHAVYTGHADWVRKLVALGAPLGPGGARELAAAVEQGDAAMVELLLSLGADPLAESPAGLPNALDRALYVMRERDRDRWGRLPAQAPLLLPLLLRHIVTVQRHPVPTIPGFPLEQAVRAAAKADGAARVRLLLQAGFDAATLSDVAAVAALGAPDRALAVELLDRGMLRGATEEGTVLQAAVAARRADVLPRLLKLGFDPNRRAGDAPSAVEAAIEQGAAAELAILLAGGGRIDAAGDVLDRAVASGNEAILRQVSANFTRSLDHVCLPDADMLARTVTTASDAFWDALRQHGFAADPNACPGQADRLVAALVEQPALIVAGWPCQRLRARLAQLGGSISAATDALITERDRDDVRELLPRSSAATPAAPVQSAAARDADHALRNSLPGTYAVASARELASAIALRADGTFAYALTYGNVDEAAAGRWEVRDRAVVFTTPPRHGQPVRLSARAGTVQPGFVTVALEEEGGHSGIDVTLLGDAPVLVAARPGRDGWRAAMTGPVRQIVMINVEAGAQVAIDVPEAQAQQRAYTLTVNRDAAPTMPFNHRMQVANGELVFLRDGMALRYRKEAQGSAGR